jgi:hypothetical protein
MVSLDETADISSDTSGSYLPGLATSVEIPLYVGTRKGRSSANVRIVFSTFVIITSSLLIRTMTLSRVKTRTPVRPVLNDPGHVIPQGSRGST